MTIGSLLRLPSSPMREAFTKSVSLVSNIPYPAWMCPKTRAALNRG